MSPTLMEGDIVTVRPQPTAAPGQLVVAAVNEEVTLKRYEVEDGIPTLIADNPEWKPVRCGPKVRVIGVVTGSFRPSEVLLRRPR
jgi:SOS-response transcriptional repressor LexA